MTSCSKIVNKLLYNLLLLKRRQSTLGNNVNKLRKVAEPSVNAPNRSHGEQGFGMAAYRHGEVGEMSVIVVSSSTFA